MKIKEKTMKTGKDFAKFLGIGILDSLIYVFLMWIVIDVLNVPTFMGSFLVNAYGLIEKFYLYALFKMMDISFKNFWKYLSINGISFLSSIVLVWFLIDVLKIPTIISSSLAIVVIFIGRFITFKKVGLIK